MDLGTIQYNVEANTTDLDKANQSFDKMADSAEKAGIEVDGAAKKFEGAGKKTKTFGEGVDAAGASMRNARGIAQNFGWQIQDVAVQLQAGTSAAVVFSQQGSQLVSAFNPLAGAFIAVAGAAAGALLPSLFAAGESADDTRSAVLELIGSLDTLTEKQKSIVESARAVEIERQTKAIKEQSSAIEDQIEKIGRLSRVGGRGMGADRSDDIKTATEERISLQRQLVELELELQKLQGNDNTSEVNAKKLKSIEDLISGLERQKNMLTLSDEQMASYIASSVKAEGADKAKIETLYGEIKAQEARIAADKKAQQLADEATRKEEQRAQSIQKMIDQLAKEAALMGNASKEAEIRYGLSNGLIQAYGAEADALIRNAQAVDAQREAMKRSNVEAGLMADFEAALGKENVMIAELDAFSQSVDNFGGAWSRTGSIVVDALGSIVDAMDDYQLQMISIGEQEKEYANLKAKYKDDPAAMAKLAKDRIKLDQQVAKANISGYKAMAGAASSMFKENTKGRKAMHSLELGLSAVEMAMSIQRSFLAAKEAVLTQGKGDPYTAFARMAAMGAIVAGLGYAVGGGGGGGGGTSAQAVQQSQGTGSVLGSNDKSASIENSFENFSDIAMDQLVELRGIRENLAKFNGGIAQLSLGVAASGLAGQKYINFTNQYVGDIIDRGGLQTRGSRSQDVAGRAMLAPLQGQISNIFGFIQDSINSATGALEIAQSNPAWAFISDIGKVSFKDMSGEEIQAELEAIFSQQADLITEFVVPSMKEYQQMGEGLFETLTRVSKEQAVFNDYMDKMGLSMQGVSSLMAIDMSQSIADMMGGFENFTDKAGEYVDRFFTEDEKFGVLQKSLTETFGALGLSLPSTTEGFRSLVEGVDRTTESGQRLFAALLEINPAFADYADQVKEQKEKEIELAQKAAEELQKIAADAAKKAEDIAKTRYSLEIELLRAQGNAELAIAMERDRILAGLDDSLRPLQIQIWATTDAIKAQEDAQKSLADTARSSFSSLSTAVDAERSRIEKVVASAGDAKSALDRAVSEEKSTLKTAYDERVNQIKAMADAEKEAQSAINKARIDSLNDERDAVQDRIGALSGLFDDLNRSIFDIALKSDELTRARRNAASFEIDTALSNARAGRGLPMDGQISQALDILRDNPSSLYATAEEMAFETARLQNKLTELAGLTGDQLSREEKSLLAIDAQIASAEASSKFYETATTKYDEMLEQATKQYDADVAAQDSILAKAQEQYDALTGIDTKALSVEAALIKYNESLLAADFENAQGQYERLDSILSTGQSQLNAMLSIDDRILTLNDGVAKFIESINAAQSDQTNKELLAQMQRMADEITQLREEQRSQAFAQQKALNTTAKNTTELVYA